MEEKVEGKNNTVIESCSLPFERNESGINQKHKIQTQTKTSYCFRICLRNNDLTVFCDTVKLRVYPTALFCAWAHTVCREAGLWVMMWQLPRSTPHSLSICSMCGVEKRVSRCIGGGEWALNLQLSKYQRAPSLRGHL